MGGGGGEKFECGRRASERESTSTHPHHTTTNKLTVDLKMFPPLLLLALSACVSSVLAIHESMNFELGPSKRECFYEEVGINEEREIEVFVNSGGFLDITIFIYGPLPLEEVYAEKFESPVLLEEKIDAEKQSVSETQTFVHLFKPEVEGIFAVCLDNRNAKFITKLVEVRSLSQVHV